MSPIAPTNCADVEPILNQIWREFRSEGIADDLAIIEHLALLLLTHHAGVWDAVAERLCKQSIKSLNVFYESLSESAHFVRNELLPTMPGGMRPERWLDVGHQLTHALQNHTPAQLFNFCIIPRLPEMLTGGRYPTPRHIAQTMARLVELQPGESLADLACGSGGLLVAAAGLKPHVTGVEISPNWARIAWANATLHDLPKPDIRIGNTFAVFSGPRTQPQFDCILMNPPFGEVVDRTLVDQSFGTFWEGRTTGRSETLLTRKALDLLKPGGRLAVLLPSGPLFARGGADQNLRESVVRDLQLQAVISLPKDAFQPYSSSQTHLLLVRKPVEGEPPPTSDIWFYQITHDGFSSGRNRQPEPEKDQLPRLVAAVLSQQDVPEFQLQTEDAIYGVSAVRSNGNTLGYRFAWGSQSKLALTVLRRNSGGAASLLARTSTVALGAGGYLLAHDEHNYGGSGQAVPLELNFPQSAAAFAGHCELLAEGLEDWSLSLAEDGARLEGKKKSIEFSATRHQDASGTFIVLLDTQGSLLCPPRWLSNPKDVLPKPLQTSPVAITPFRCAEGGVSGELLVFERPSLETITLTAANGAPVHFCDLNNVCLLLWPDGEGAIKHIDVLKSSVTYSGEEGHLAVAVDRQGYPFGLCVKHTGIAAKAYDLLTATYFPAERAEREQRPPAQLLADIKTKHRDLDRRIDYLLGIVELKAVAQAKLPPPVHAAIGPIGTLNLLQRTAWERVCAQVDSWPNDDGSRYLTPRPFRIEDINEGLPAADVQRALDLFECMGLIVRVSIEGAPYYRRIAERDVEGSEAAS